MLALVPKVLKKVTTKVAAKKITEKKARSRNWTDFFFKNPQVKILSRSQSSAVVKVVEHISTNL